MHPIIISSLFEEIIGAGMLLMLALGAISIAGFIVLALWETIDDTLFMIRETIRDVKKTRAARAN